MTRRDWQVTVDFTTSIPIEEETLFDLIEEFAEHGASAALNPDGMGGSLTVSVTTASAMEAISVALVMFSDASTLNSADISGINVIEQDKARLLNREPLFPKVVGYAEIARMTGVSRQRAAMFPKIATFPKPVIETSQGPLYSEHAVAAWAAKRGVKAGRPKTAEVPPTTRGA